MALPAPTVEVQWDHNTWTDETSRLHGWANGHGGARQANPDRPTPEPAAGTMVLDGEPTAAAGRFACRATHDGRTLWSGWAQEPRRLTGPVRTVWKLTSDNTANLSKAITLNAAAGNVGALLAGVATAMGANLDRSNIPNRQMKALAVEGRAGGLLSRAAQAASAELVENRLGRIVAASAHISARPASTPAISAADTTILKPDTVRRADRIRTRATVVIDSDPDLSTLRVPFTARVSSGAVAWPMVLTATVPLPAGATYSEPMATATAEAAVVTGVTGRATSYADGSTNYTGPYSVTATTDFAATATATATIAEDNRSATITITVADPNIANQSVSVRWRQTNSAYGIPLPWSATVPVIDGFGSAIVHTFNRTVSRTQLNSISATGTLTVTRAVGTPPQNVLVIDQESENIWGQRPLELAPWADDTDTTIVEAIIDSLADERAEHTITIPLTEAAALDRDAGDYATLQITDTGFGIDVNQVCLIVGRSLAFGRRQIPRVTLRLLETPVAGPRPVRPPTGLVATALTTTSIRVTWGDVPAGSEPATGWHTETRPVTSTGAWARVASDANARTVDITGLSPSTAYDVRVRAVTSGGDSGWANTTVRTPAPEPAPGVPQNLAVNAVGTSAIDADWNAPVTGGSVTSYTLRWRPHGSGSAWSSRSGFSGRSGRITGLSASTDYDVQVRANGPGGPSGYSASARATTADPPAPGVPTMVAASAWNTTIRVTWGDPSDGGAAANYTVEWTAGGVGLTHTLGAGVNAYSITGLTNDVEYTIRVRASNAGGTSAWSVPVTATPEEVALMGPTFSRGAGNVVANIYIRIRMDTYTAPAGYTRNNNSAVEVEVSDGNAADHGWNDANPNNRNYAWWQVHRYHKWPHTSWPKQIRARISLTPPGGGANVWSAWETTTFGTASSAPTDRTFSAWTLDGRLLLLDDKLIGQENQT